MCRESEQRQNLGRGLYAVFEKARVKQARKAQGAGLWLLRVENGQDRPPGIFINGPGHPGVPLAWRKEQQ